MMEYTKLISILRKFLNNKDSIWGLLYGFGLFLLAEPFFMWHTGNLKFYIIITLIIISLFSIRTKFYSFEILLFLLLFYLLINRILEFKILGIIAVLFPLSFLIINKHRFVVYYKWFKFIFSISILLSAFYYILVVIFRLPLDYSIIEPLVKFKTYDYKQYLFLVMPNGFDEDVFDMIRYTGMFDESGVVGTFCAIIIVNEKFNLKTFSNIIIFIGGFFSLSFFYFITIAFFAIYYLNNKLRLMILVSTILLYFLTVNNPLIYSNVWERLEFKDGELKGENRSSAILNQYYRNFLESEDALWGMGLNYIEKIDDGASASYKQFVINNGIFYAVCTILFFLLYSFFTIKSKKDFFAFILIFIFTMYQRPFIFQPIYFYLMVVFVRRVDTPIIYLKNNFKIKSEYQISNFHDFSKKTFSKK